MAAVASAEGPHENFGSENQFGVVVKVLAYKPVDGPMLGMKTGWVIFSLPLSPSLPPPLPLFL